MKPVLVIRCDVHDEELPIDARDLDPRELARHWPHNAADFRADPTTDSYGDPDAAETALGRAFRFAAIHLGCVRR